MVRWFSCIGLVVCLSSAAALGQTSRIELVPVVSGLNQPVYVTHSHDGSRRMFIVEQPGRILVTQPGTAITAVFLDLTSRILCCGERGLLGLAFHPQYSANRRFFVNYTRQPDGATVVAEYRVSNLDANQGDFASEVVLLEIAQPYANHNGGMIEFGPDGNLYIGTADRATIPRTARRTSMNCSAKCCESTWTILQAMWFLTPQWHRIRFLAR